MKRRFETQRKQIIQPAEGDNDMHALSFANDITGYRHAASRETLFDRACRSIELGRFTEGLDDLFTGVEQIRNASGLDAWSAFVDRARTDRRLMSLVHQDPFTKRAFDKPRGYAGDAVMMDYAYGIHGAHEATRQASDFGRALLGYLQMRPAVQSARYRREHIARLIDATAAVMAQPSILAVASGHLREAELSTALTSGRVGSFVALDADRESLREVETQYSRLGVETIHASVRHMLARKVTRAPFDFVYAAGLYDYLNDNVAVALTARLFELTRPGGNLLIPNFAPSCPDRGYMESCMAWDLIYRDEYDMTRLVAHIPVDQIASYDVYSDPSGSVVYLRIEKNKPTPSVIDFGRPFRL
jgi:extracellular factor (EF) 3-hydroxypalmitic acid methyl ester biosynthesis protein